MNTFTHFFNIPNKEKDIKKPVSYNIYEDQEYTSDYDINDIKFITYFEKRTGLLITKMETSYKKLLCKKSNVDETHLINTKKKLQNVWEIYKKTLT